jgi:hypothetical protein
MRRHECRSGQPYTASVLHLAICEALGAVDASMLATFAPKHLLSLSDAYVRPLVLAPAPRPCFDSPRGLLAKFGPAPHLASYAHALLAGRRRATANGYGMDPTRAAHEAAPVGSVDPGASLAA